MLRERDHRNVSEGPEMLDDGWWASVLRDEEAKLPARGGSASSGNGYHPVSATNSQADWEAARVLYHSDGTIELEATGFNRGGLLVAWNSLRGFVPASHLIGFPNEAPELERKSALAERVSQHLSLKVIEFDPIKGRIVFSERAARSGPGSRQTLLQRLQTGDHVDGVVTNVCDFGVFVDLGGIEGLIHVSEVSWNRVAHPRDVVAVNQSVNVLVMSVDRDQGRVALSLKRQRPDPWASVESRYSIGQLIDGKITNVVNFGAFIALEDGLEGLIHISELAEGQFFHPRNVVTEGEVVRAKIISIDGNHRRLSLSLRRLAEGPLTVSTITA